MTRQDNNSTEGKVTRVAFNGNKKCPSLLEINSSQRDTALCSAVLAQSDTDVMQKNEKNTLHIFPIPQIPLKIFPRSMPSPTTICMMSVEAVYGQ